MALMCVCGRVMDSPLHNKTAKAINIVNTHHRVLESNGSLGLTVGTCRRIDHVTTQHVSSLVPERQLTGSRVTGVWGGVHSTWSGVYITGSGDKRSGDVMREGMV